MLYSTEIKMILKNT